VQALLIATGETEKLKPLTENMPSPVIPLANKPIMSYAVELLARQGIKKILVSLNYLANQVETFFETGRRWGVRFDYLLQREGWGTAGALKWAETSLNETFLVLPADSIVEFDIHSALEFHKSCSSKFTVITNTSERAADRQIIVGLNELVVGFEGDQEQTISVSDTGAYIIEPEVLAYIPARTKYDIHHELIPALLEKNIEVHSYQMTGYWNPLDTYKEYQEAQHIYLQSGHKQKHFPDVDHPILEPSFDGVQVSPGIWIAGNNLIHPTARFAPPVYIARNCRIGRDVEIGPEVVIASNVIIDDDASISKSTILDHTYVGKLVNIENRLVYQDRIIDMETGDSLRITDNFLLGPIYESDVNSSLKRAFDVIMSAGLILLSFPIYILFALLIYPQTGHLFRRFERQSSGNSFTIIRFETRDLDNKPIRTGKWIELLGLERLPELLSVLKGDMSMIGVKPLSPQDLEQAKEAWQQRRFESKPGFTGLWYIQTNKKSSLDEVFITDAYYVSTRSGRKDLILLFQTVAAWSRKVRLGVKEFIKRDIS
jgi:NDP-sugar pyrophosphorylase family protein